jgi:hypothetical protein
MIARDDVAKPDVDQGARTRFARAYQDAVDNPGA